MSNTGELPYKGQVQCILCCRTLMNYRGYRVHLGRMHKHLNQPCHSCFKKIGDRKRQIAHGQEHLRRGDRVCLLCRNANFQDREIFISHLNLHAAKLTSYSACPICGELLSTPQETFDHLITEHSLPESCSSIIKNEDVSIIKNEDVNMDEDVNVDEDVKPNVKFPNTEISRCAKCPYYTAERDAFKEHLLTHKTIKGSFQCLQCGLCFIIEETLKKHLKVVHKIGDPNGYIKKEGNNFVPDKCSTDTIFCDVCYDFFESETLFNLHYRRHGLHYLRSIRRRRNGL